jgi:hypothetical protein
LPSVADETRLYAQRILEGREALDVSAYQTLGLATTDQVATIKDAINADVAGFDYALDRSTVRHVDSAHGDPKIEANRGQRAVIASDYAHLPLLLNAPDAIEAAGKSWRSGQPLVRVRKQIDGEEFTAVFELRRQRRMLALESLYIVKKEARP